VNLAKFYSAVWSPWGNEITVQLLLEMYLPFNLRFLKAYIYFKAIWISILT